MITGGAGSSDLTITEGSLGMAPARQDRDRGPGTDDGDDRRHGLESGDVRGTALCGARNVSCSESFPGCFPVL